MVFLQKNCNYSEVILNFFQMQNVSLPYSLLDKKPMQVVNESIANENFQMNH